MAFLFHPSGSFDNCCYVAVINVFVGAPVPGPGARFAFFMTAANVYIPIMMTQDNLIDVGIIVQALYYMRHCTMLNFKVNSCGVKECHFCTLYQ